MNSRHTPTVTRRTVLRGAAGAAAASAGLASAGAAAAQEANEPDYGGWFDNVSNYDGTVDRTGEDSVTVSVGAQGNNGAFAFAPAAVRVDPGTEVVWEWTGGGGQHNVAAESGAFESDLTDEAGFTFSQTLEDVGVNKYVCVPHEQMGMKGAVVVGTPGGGEGSGTKNALALGGATGLVGVLLALFAYGASENAER